MPETVERSMAYRVGVGIFAVVILIIGIGMPLLGFQIQPCYGGRCQIFNLALSNLVGRAVIAGLALILGLKLMSIAVSGEEELIK